jgi:hypothetical protein
MKIGCMSSTQNAFILNEIARPMLIYIYFCFRAVQEALDICGYGYEEEEEEEGEYLDEEGQDVERRWCELIVTDLF